MKMRRTSLTRLASTALAISLLQPVTLAATTTDAESVDALADEAVLRNPGLEAISALSRELAELAEVSNTWPDPQVGVEYMNAPVDSFKIGDTPMGGVEFMLRQRLPEWGFTRAARAVADHRVLQSQYESSEAELQLRRGVETLYWKLTLSRLLEDVTRQHVLRTDELIRAVQARYEVGKAGQNTLLRLEVLRERLEDDLGDFVRAERELSAGLSRALARPPETRFETLARVAPIAPEGAAADWILQAEQHRPQLAALREEIKREQKAASLSRIETRPELDLWVKYRVRTVSSATDSGTDFFSAGLSLPIPWGSRKRGLGREAASLEARDGAKARLAAALDEIEAGLVAVEAGWRRAAEKSATYEQRLIPAARTALETTLYDFAVGKAEFSSLYEAEVDLLVLERAHLSAAVETHIQRAAARALSGRREIGASS